MILQKDMKRFFLIIVLFSMISCCDQNKADYRKNGAKISRIDDCGKTTFSYYDRLGNLKGEIFSEYAGINDGFNAYLYFSSDGSVEILVGDGYFEAKSTDTALFNHRPILSGEILKTDSNFYEVTFPIEYERDNNLNGHSNIEVTYHK